MANCGSQRKSMLYVGRPTELNYREVCAMNMSLRGAAFVCSLALVAPNVHAEDQADVGQALFGASQASAQVSASVAQALVASGQVTSAALAVPLSISGAVFGSAATASTAAARDSMRAAAAPPIGTPLPITNETITVVPPNEALRRKRDDEKR
jgi:hypothetical protein